METLLKILAELRPDVDFEENKELVDSGELDSFDIVSLVGELCDEYDIEIGADEIVPENFNSVEAIWALVQRLPGGLINKNYGGVKRYGIYIISIYRFSCTGCRSIFPDTKALPMGNAFCC